LEAVNLLLISATLPNALIASAGDPYLSWSSSGSLSLSSSLSPSFFDKW